MRGAHIRYSDAELAFVERHHTMRRTALHTAFVARFGRRDVTVDHLKSLCSRKGWSTRTRWDADAMLVVTDHYPYVATALLAQELGRSPSAVSQLARKLDLKKDPEYLASEGGRIKRGERRGTATEFRKGQTPANKGVKRGRGWAPGRMARTQFRAGQLPHTWMPVGSTRLIGGYEYTKVSDLRHVPYTANWKATHQLRWEAMHGPVPEGHALKCLDGNRRNTDPRNWEAVPRGVLARLNGGRHQRSLAYDAAPAALKPTVLMLAKLKHAVSTRRNAA